MQQNPNFEQEKSSHSYTNFEIENKIRQHFTHVRTLIDAYPQMDEATKAQTRAVLGYELMVFVGAPVVAVAAFLSHIA